MEIEVTNHAKKRFKQRVGLPKSACQRHAEKAFYEGLTHTDVKGRMKRFFNKLYLEYRSANNLRLYGEFIYLFKGTRLITVIHFPKGMKNYQ